MKTRLLLALTIILTATSYGMDQATIMISKVLDESSRDTRDMLLKHGDSSETLHVDRNIIISDKDIVEATLIEGDHPAVRIRLTEEGKKKFAELTKESINKRLALVLDDQLVSAPVVRAEITGGVLDISGNMTREFAEKVVQTIQKNQKG